MDLKKYFLSIRLLNCLIAAIGVFIGFSVSQKAISFPIELFLAIIATITITGAGNIINDYYDLLIDKKLEKNVLSEKTEKKEAILVTGLLFSIGIISAFLINLHAFLIALGISILLILYSVVMQKFKYVGNWVVALGTAMTLIFGATITKSYDAILILSASALFANAAREIIKDTQDLKGDYGEKKTLPMIIGIENIKKIIPIIYLISISFGALAWTSGVMIGPYYIILLFVVTILFFNSWKLLKKNKFKAAQEYSKYGMLFALLAFIGGIL